MLQFSVNTNFKEITPFYVNIKVGKQKSKDLNNAGNFMSQKSVISMNFSDNIRAQNF